MRYILLLGILCLAGCLNVTGPLMPRLPERVDDPRISIAEQESRARNRWALPDETHGAGPSSQSAFPAQR